MELDLNNKEKIKKMTDNNTMPFIRNVSDTAWMVAAARAIEAERSDALFGDPLANMLLGTGGPEIIQSIKHRKDNDLSLFIAVRTLLIDKLVTEVVLKHDIDAVVNLACGLCTRPYRLNLPTSLHWIDVDFEPVIQHRKDHLKEVTSSCSITHVAVDLRIDQSRRDLLAETAADFHNILVITEGLLPYLDEKTVMNLAADLLRHPQYKFWLADTYGSSLVSNAVNTEWKEIMEKAKFQFYTGYTPEFFAQQGWTTLKVQTFLNEAKTLNRYPNIEDSASNTEVEVWRDSKLVLLER
jgi:methyltransferase (TIGR00027 family)